MKKILIVDDSEMARKSVCFSLSSRHYSVLEACNGKDAAEQLKKQDDVGLVITDLNMPEMDGLQLVGWIRANYRPADLPVYVITTERKTGDEVIERGATGFIIKSSKTSEEMQKIVTKHIG
jgi:two-component system chemotaxis response regulator CheY